MKTQPKDLVTADLSGNQMPTGLTKIEYFTAAALTGFCANSAIGNDDEDKIAKYAVSQAMATINEINR